MLSISSIVVFLVLIKLVVLRMILDFSQDAQEPPPVDLWIPFISPLLRMGWNGFAYYKEHCHFPIYTIRLPGKRLYVVNSTSLIPVVQHHPRTLSFSPMLERAAINLIGASRSGIDVLSDDEENGFIRRFHDFNHASMSAGSGLETLRKRYWRTINTSHCQMLTGLPKRTFLYEWISNDIMMAVTGTIYGARNPFQDPVNRIAWHTFQSGITRLMTGFMPRAISKSSLQARETLVRSFRKYYINAKLDFDREGTSPYIKHQYHLFSDSGLSDLDIAKTEAAFTIALLGNLLPATFWLVYHIFSNQMILQDCRKELSATLCRNCEGALCLDLRTVESSCPILSSTLKETLRAHSVGTSVTQVLEDQVIDDQYLLKKGALVLIPAIIQHSNRSIWGEDVDKFNHLRFLEEGEAGRKSRSPIAFRVFGGGWNLCPGRHIANSVIIGFAASVILRFDIQPSSGKWVTPTTKNSNLAIAIEQPDKDLEVELDWRKQEEWKPVFRESDC